MQVQLVCPRCSYGFETEENVSYSCPNAECGYAWQSLSATIVTAFTVEGRRPRPELHFRSGERVGLVYTVEQPRVLLGRADDCDITFTNLEISRHHVEIRRIGDECLLLDQDSRRGTFVNGRRVKSHPLRMGDEILIAGILIEYRVRFEASAQVDALPEPAPEPSTDRSRRQLTTVRFRNQPLTRIPLEANGGGTDGARQITVGRQPDRDICIEHPLMSRRHAVLLRDAEGWSVIDAKSRNGTFVNGHAVIQARLQRGDRVQFGPERFLFDGRSLTWQEAYSQTTLEARGLTVRVPAGLGRRETVILDGVDIRVEPSELVGIIGPSGSGKTTLLNALSGFRRATAGLVAVNGQPLHGEGGSVRAGMGTGYVPQDDIIHTELTARQALRYAGRLRLPRDTTAEELDRLVEETLETLGLGERADLRISRLSGGQRKRVSLGVELLTRADLIFMDEPTSGLDPGTEARMMRLFRRLADQGRTMVLTTHVMENVDALDKVAVLAAGRLVYFGPPREMMAYFGIARATDLYDRLEDREPDEWRTLYARSPERAKYLGDVDGGGANRSGERSALGAAPGGAGRLDAWTQLRVLTHRYGRILLGDWRNVALMVLQPLIIFPATCAVFDHAGTILFLAALAMFWLGTTNAAREIVRERPIYLRERMVGVNVAPYVLSKILVLLIASLAQTAFAVGVIRFLEGVPGDALLYGLILLATTLSGLALGLFISAVASTSEQATAVLPMVLIPQIVFGGFILAIDRMNAASAAASNLISTRWTYEALKLTFQERHYDVLWRDLAVVLGFATVLSGCAMLWLRLRDRRGA
jgi:ABC-type multidrug transport system ATPase subunit